MNFNFSAGKLREILSMAESCYVCGESLLPNSGRRVMSDQLKSFLRLEVSSGHLYLCKTCYSKTNKGANQEAAARNILHELWTTIRETGITTNSTVSSYGKCDATTQTEFLHLLQLSASLSSPGIISIWHSLTSTFYS